jgi:hypothetical protein
MYDSLEESTDMLRFLKDYCTKMRRAVLENMDVAKNCGFTFVDLDTIDDVTLLIKQNCSAMRRAENIRKKEKTKRKLFGGSYG